MKRLLITLLFISGSAISATGDQAITLGYIQMKSDGLNKLSKNMESTVKDLTEATGAPFSVKGGGYDDPRGMFLRYRYELDDSWGIIGSVAYAQQSTTVKVRTDGASNSFDGQAKLTGDYVSGLIGPTYRFNKYVSLYGMAGAAYKHVKQSGDGRLVIENHATTVSDSRSESKVNLAYSVGTQINLFERLVLDAAYEGSTGNSDWKANGFTVGIGYTF